MSNEDLVRDNPTKSRFEVHVGDSVAFLTYRDLASGARVFLHTEVPPPVEGHGIGTRLVKGALDDARSAGRRVVPKCPFVADFIARHPEYQPLVVPPE
jgi:uncharacterized protein